jgi:hypothetical protein
MTLRFTTSRALGLAVALSLGSAATAAAQIPVRKDPVPTPTPAPTTPAPTPVPEPTPTPVTPPTTMDTTRSVDTTTSSATVTTESTGEVPMRSGTRWGNGFYVGIHGGTNFPQNEINGVYDTGYNVGGQLGWQPMGSPLGVRLNASWNRLNGRTLTNQQIGNVQFTGDLQSADVYNAFADAKLMLPILGRNRVFGGLYAVGGAGLSYLRNFDRFQTTTGTTVGESRTGTFNPEDATRFAANAGGGLSWGVGNVSLFVEGRWVRVFTQDRNTDFVPVTVGLTFH